MVDGNIPRWGGRTPKSSQTIPQCGMLGLCPRPPPAPKCWKWLFFEPYHPTHWDGWKPTIPPTGMVALARSLTIPPLINSLSWLWSWLQLQFWLKFDGISRFSKNSMKIVLIFIHLWRNHFFTKFSVFDYFWFGLMESKIFKSQKLYIFFMWTKTFLNFEAQTE